MEYETKSEIDKNPSVRIEGLTSDDVRAVIAGLINSKYGLDEFAKEKIEEAAHEAVSKLTKEVAETAVREAVANAIANGVTTYSKYGGHAESNISVPSLVHQELTKRSSDGYRDQGKTIAEKVISDMTKELFEKELKGEIESLKKEFRAQTDAVFKTKIVEAMKEAIGLK